LRDPRIATIIRSMGRTPSPGTPVTPGELRPGDTVRLRPARAILATLDETASFEGVPFMPEMARYAGRTLTVYKRLEKICDYFGESRSRRMTDAVLLEDARCDGSAHGGCQAECRIFWKEAWLEHASPDAPADDAAADIAELVARTAPHAVREAPDAEDTRYRCQATEARAATQPMPEKALGQYVREVRVGNVSAWEVLRVGASALALKVKRKLGLEGPLPVAVAGAERADGTKLELSVGDWVRIRPNEEIGRTLDAAASHRGLLFTHEMAHCSGETHRVRSRVERLVDERTGKLLQMKSECIALEGCVCTGRHTSGAWFCAREHFPLWREDWLERVDPPPDATLSA
jgi:hypothetical protein